MTIRLQLWIGLFWSATTVAVVDAHFHHGRHVLAAASLRPRRRHHRQQHARQRQHYCLVSVRGGGNEGVVVGAAATATHSDTVLHHAKTWRLDGLKSGTASALAAACVKTVLQPIDAVKTCQQYYQSHGHSLSLWQACQVIAARRPGGVANFYAGLGVTVFGAMPGVALYFGVYSALKRYLTSHTKWGTTHPTICVAMSAAIGNSIASVSRVPYEVLKQKLQTQVYDSTWSALRAVSSSNTWWTLLFPRGGVWIQMIRDVPYAVVTLLVYESLQGWADTHPDLIPAHYRNFVVGGLAGGLGSWVTNPMDVVKTRLQTDSDKYGGSVRQCARMVLDEGGPSAFLRGSVPRLLHKIPANAFFFFFYEIFKRLLHVQDVSNGR